MDDLRPNRRLMGAQHLTAHVLQIVSKHLREDVRTRDIAHDLEDLFYANGAQIITEHDRARAGLQPRDGRGYTLEELAIYEAKLRMAALTAMPRIVTADDTEWMKP